MSAAATSTLTFILTRQPKPGARVVTPATAAALAVKHASRSGRVRYIVAKGER